MNIRRRFSPPTFADEKQTRQGRMLHFIILSLLLVADTQFIFIFFLLPQYWPRWLGVLLTFNLTLPPLVFLNHRGHTRLAGALLLAELWTLATVLAVTAHGIQALAVWMYVVYVLMAGLVFHERGGLIAGACLCLTVLGLVLLEKSDLLPHSEIAYTTASIWLMVAMCLEWTTILQCMANHSTTNALQRANQIEIALRDSEQRYREVFETTSDLIFLLDITTDGRFLGHLFNPAYEKVFGLKSSELAGRTPEQIVPPNEARIVKANLQRCIAQGSPIDYEETLTAAHGKSHWFHTNLIPIKNAEGRIYRIVGVARDITERREAEAALRRSRDELEMRVQERTAELRQVNAELQEVNRELEAFSYSVSHDLRRPLRMVTGFTDLLMADYARDLPSDGQNLLALTREGTQQMNQLIESLLNLSRVDRQRFVPRPVNLAEIARQVIQELRGEHQDRNLDIRVADLPESLGDPELLRQVLVNLLSNAIKFTRDRRVAVIEVGFKQEQGKTIYFVRDNGAGFDMRQADKLFGVFQRLHSIEQFKGTGVGLSIVRRIIHRHGGKIWAEAAVEQGATFYFTLPAVPAKPDPATMPMG